MRSRSRPVLQRVRSPRARRLAGSVLLAGPVALIGLVAAKPLAASADPASAGTSIGGFTAAAVAPVMQITEDEPTSQFHPEGEGDYGYSTVNMGPAAASALAATAWPGSVAGNAGSLVGVLGGPSSASALNDPVRAQAATGTAQTDQTISAPTGTVMSAAVASDADGGESAVAKGSLAGGAFGVGGTMDNSTTDSSLVFDPTADTLTASATSDAGGIDLAGGLVSIGSVTSSAHAVSKGGATPTETGQTVFQDMKIAGQSAYVDSSGVHVGTPGQPAPSFEQQLVDTALQASGMQVYFTDPHELTVGQVAYYYSGSVLFYWAVPQDPSDNSVTVSLGGAAVAMQVSAAPVATAFTPAPSARTAAAGSSRPTARAGAPPTVASATLAGPTAGAGAGPILSLPPNTSPGAGISAGLGRGTSGQPVRSLGILAGDASPPGGLGVGWWLLILFGGLLGAILLPRLPALFTSTASACPRERRP